MISQWILFDWRNVTDNISDEMANPAWFYIRSGFSISPMDGFHINLSVTIIFLDFFKVFVDIFEGLTVNFQVEQLLLQHLCFFWGGNSIFVNGCFRIFCIESVKRKYFFFYFLKLKLSIIPEIENTKIYAKHFGFKDWSLPCSILTISLIAKKLFKRHFLKKE